MVTLNLDEIEFKTKIMKTIELTKEQRDMIANCILEQMHNWRKTLDIITSSAEMRTLVENEIGKLKTLLDYINS